MVYADEKRRLYTELVHNGAQADQFAATAKAIGVEVPPDMRDRWQRRFYRVPTMSYPLEPRLINRFMVGADPEFVFAQSKPSLEGGSSTYVHAQQLGLDLIDAFGCDMSGRQAELRAYPSRFCLDIVASILDTLRWMNESLGVGRYQWLAPAQYMNDGVGGHVHIGRKRPRAEAVVRSLDGLTRVLLATRAFDADGQEFRKRVTAYGHYGDYRSQTHGFEYRTMPSWLYSPWAAYLTLVLSKLAVVEDFTNMITPQGAPEHIVWNLLRAYQNRDDDARLALIALNQHGMPKYTSVDFKSAWGIGTPNGRRHNTYFPPVIEGSAAAKQQLFQHFTRKAAINPMVPIPTWAPVELKDGVSKVSAAPHTPGVADIASGLLVKDCLASCQRGMGRKQFSITEYGLGLDSKAISKVAKTYTSLKSFQITVKSWVVPEGPKNSLTLYIPPELYNSATHIVDSDMRRDLRALLTEHGLFPIAKYTDYEKLLKYVPRKKKEMPVRGRLLYITGEGEQQ